MTDFHYAEAARRHHTDAQTLHAARRVPNADQLYGFAAECALLGIIQCLPNTDIYFNPDGSVRESRVRGKNLREHINFLWRNFKNIADGHRGRIYTARLNNYPANPFETWHTDQRYYSDAASSAAPIDAHSKAATYLLTALQDALGAVKAPPPPPATPQGGKKS